LQLAQKAVDHHALKAQDFSEQERHLSQFPSDDRIHLHYTSYLVIMNNNEQVIMTPIEKGSDNGYIVDWSRIHIHHPTTSIISSMAAVASPRTVNMLKAKFLESELGL
jgi:hypothetical protein